MKKSGLIGFHGSGNQRDLYVNLPCGSVSSYATMQAAEYVQ